MLLLIFRSGESRYAFDAHRVAEVVPRVGVRAIPHAPAYVMGLLSYRGLAVPVIDFGILIGACPARDVLSSRVVLIEFRVQGGAARMVGVVAENVSHVVKVDESQFISPAMTLEEAPYLGAILKVDEGLVQLIVADKLLSERMQAALYGAMTEPR